MSPEGVLVPRLEKCDLTSLTVCLSSDQEGGVDTSISDIWENGSWQMGLKSVGYRMIHLIPHYNMVLFTRLLWKWTGPQRVLKGTSDMVSTKKQ